MGDDNRDTARAAIVNTIGNILSLLAAVIMIPITSHLLSTEDMGMTVTFQSGRDIWLIIVTFSSYIVVQRGILDFKEDKKTYLNSVMFLNYASAVIIFSGYIIFLLLTGRGVGGMTIFMIFSIFCWMPYYVGYYYLMFHNRYVLTFIIALLTGPCAQLLSVFLILSLEKNKYLGRIIGLDFFYWLVGLICLVMIAAGSHMKIRKDYIKYTLGISAPLVPHLLSQQILSQSDILMITSMVGAGQSGIYSMAYTISQLLWLLLSQIMNVWSPWVYRRLDENETEAIFQNSQTIMWLSSVFAIGLMVIAPEAVTIFLAPSYHDGMYIIPTLVVGAFLKFLYLFFYDVEYFHKKTGYIAVAAVAAAVTNLVLNFLFIPRFGYIAAGVTTAIGYLVLVLLHYVFMRRLDKRKIYNNKTICLTTLIVTLYAVLLFVLIDRPVLRYVAGMASIAVIVFLQRQKVIGLLKVIKK